MLRIGWIRKGFEALLLRGAAPACVVLCCMSLAAAADAPGGGGAAGSGAPGAPAAVAPDLGAIFGALEGWKPAGEVKSYTPESLWEYIDGAAELFIHYGVRGVRAVDVSSAGVTVTVNVFDMGSDLNAFGIYRSEGSADSMPLAIGGEAVAYPPYQALMFKGACYVKVDAPKGGLTEPPALDLLAKLAAAIPGEGRLPEEVKLLPAEGRVKGTEGYAAGGFLGLSELTKCVYAAYGTDAGKRVGFVVLGDPDAAWAALAAKWTPAKAGALDILWREVPYKGRTGVVRAGSRIHGVSGAADEAELGRLLHSMARPAVVTTGTTNR